MNIKEMLKRLFVKEKIITSIANISDNVVVLNRKDLNEDDYRLKMLDAYKKEYSKVLSLKKTIFSGDFGNNNIHEEIEMYRSLIMNLIEPKDSGISFEKIYGIEEPKEFEYNCKMSKIKVYIESLLMNGSHKL